MEIELSSENSKKLFKSAVARKVIDDTKEFRQVFNAVKEVSDTEVIAMAETIQYAMYAKMLNREIKEHLQESLKFSNEAEKKRVGQILSALLKPNK